MPLSVQEEIISLNAFRFSTEIEKSVFFSTFTATDA
jgi:hypothetical protein